MKKETYAKSKDDSKSNENKEKLDMYRYKDYVVPKEILERPSEREYLKLLEKKRKPYWLNQNKIQRIFNACLELMVSWFRFHKQSLQLLKFSTKNTGQFSESNR